MRYFTLILILCLLSPPPSPSLSLYLDITPSSFLQQSKYSGPGLYLPSPDSVWSALYRTVY